MARVKQAPLRVMLVDDHQIVRDGIRGMLQATEDVVVTAEASTVREAIDEADRTRPDVVVMDVRLADGSGIEATREIRAQHPAVDVDVASRTTRRCSLQSLREPRARS